MELSQDERSDQFATNINIVENNRIQQLQQVLKGLLLNTAQGNMSKDDPLNESE